MTTSSSFDRDDPPILGANPFVGLTRGQVAAALARLAQRAAVEPGAAAGDQRSDAARRPRRVGVGRSDVAPAKGDRRFADRAWRDNPVFRRLMQAYLVEQRRRPPARRRGRARPQEPRPRPLRHVAAHRSGRADQQPAHQPQRAGQGGPDPRAEPRRRRPPPRPRRPSQRRHAVAGRHPPVHGRRQPRRHARAGRAPHRGVRADPVRTGRRRQVHAATARRRSRRRSTSTTSPTSRPGRSLVEHTVAAGIPYFAVSWRNPTPEQRDWNLDTYVAAVPGGDRGRLRHHRQRRRQRRRHVRRRHHAGVPARPPRRHRRASLVQLGDVPGRRARHHAGEPRSGCSTSRRADRGGPGALAAGRASSTATTWPRCSPGCAPTTSCGTTGSTTTCSARTRPRSTSSTGTPTPPACRPGCTPTSSTCT